MGNKVLTVIGLMSGTSMDGIDAAIIRTDGVTISERLGSYSLSYNSDFKNKIRALIAGKTKREDVEGELTELHAEAVKSLLGKTGFATSDIDLIGFHGQTIKHDPAHSYTLQIGDGALLAKLTGINVINDMRSNDVACGGHGAPLAPLYHKALVEGHKLPVAILNIGGISNVTLIGEKDYILAFDTGTGNALIDDWILNKSGKAYDDQGNIARRGKVNKQVLAKLLDNPFFDKLPPKSLDRHDFSNSPAAFLSLEDGAATLTQFTIDSIVKSTAHFPVLPKKWYITGGGRHNQFIMKGLAKALGAKIFSIEELKVDGDMVEAEAFAYLAARSFYQMPLSLPTTTGVPKPTTGGVLHKVVTSKKELTVVSG